MVIIKEKQIWKKEIIKKIESRKNEKTISFEEAYMKWKDFINNLWR